MRRPASAKGVRKGAMTMTALAQQLKSNTIVKVQRALANRQQAKDPEMKVSKLVWPAGSAETMVPVFVGRSFLLS